MERLFEHITDLAMYFTALTGESFWSSGRSVVRIFRRNMLVGFTTDMLSQVLFSTASICASALVGMGSFVFVAHILRSEYGFQTSILFSLLVWYILRIFTSIFSDTMDATFICFAIDLDTEKMHAPTVHQTFSHRIQHSSP